LKSSPAKRHRSPKAASASCLDWFILPRSPSTIHWVPRDGGQTLDSALMRCCLEAYQCRSDSLKDHRRKTPQTFLVYRKRGQLLFISSRWRLYRTHQQRSPLFGLTAENPGACAKDKTIVPIQGFGPWLLISLLGPSLALHNILRASIRWAVSGFRTTSAITRTRIAIFARFAPR
jgi:hypothetical protein